MGYPRKWSLINNGSSLYQIILIEWRSNVFHFKTLKHLLTAWKAKTNESNWNDLCSLTDHFLWEWVENVIGSLKEEWFCSSEILYTLVSTLLVNECIVYFYFRYLTVKRRPENKLAFGIMMSSSTFRKKSLYSKDLQLDMVAILGYGTTVSSAVQNWKAGLRRGRRPKFRTSCS